VVLCVSEAKFVLRLSQRLCVSAVIRAGPLRLAALCLCMDYPPHRRRDDSPPPRRIRLQKAPAAAILLRASVTLCRRPPAGGYLRTLRYLRVLGF